MVNFYRRFLRSAAEYLGILDQAAVTKKKNDKTLIQWNDKLNNAFEKTKSELAKATLLRHPSAAGKLALYTDASDTCVGAVLHQEGLDGYHPLGFFSKRLSETKQRYSTYDRELEAIFQGVRHFKDEIEGRDLVIYCDHKPLHFAMTKTEKTTNQRQARQFDFISQFTNKIKYIPGKQNDVADSLSRINALKKACSSS